MRASKIGKDKVIKSKRKTIVLNPGSVRAVAAGCLCPVLDNECGRGWMGGPEFVFNEACPLHGRVVTDALKAGKWTDSLDSIIDRLRTMYPHGHPDFIGLTLKEMELHSKKNYDYTGGGANEPLGNFYRVAKLLSTYPNLKLSDPTVVALVYMLKQVDSTLWQLHQGYEGQVEGMDGRLGDVSVYAKLAKILYEETRSGIKNNPYKEAE